MNEYQAAVAQFEQGIEVNLFDLGAGLLLEYFALPLLIFSNKYVPLLRRKVLPPWEPVIARLNELAPKTADQSELDDALVRIGRGLDRRYQLQRRINCVAITSRLAVLIMHSAIVLAIVLGPNRWVILGGWFCAMLMAMVVCLSDQHWRRRGGFRRNPG